MDQHIKKVITCIVDKLPKKNIIIFESNPDFSDNTKAVFDEMLRRGINKHYKLIWLTGEKSNEGRLEAENTYSYYHYHKGLKGLYIKYLLTVAKLFISCNRFMECKSSTQGYFYLAHGCALKRSPNYYVPERLPQLLAVTLSDYLKKYDAINLRINESRIVPLGFPRCDALFRQSTDMKALFQSDAERAIYWLPTYRQHIRSKRVISSLTFPIIADSETAERINTAARQNGVLIIIKPHPSQDMSKIAALKLSNIKLIDDAFLAKNHLSNYKLLGSCDALLTDYSSVYYDYLLCDKPIGLCVEDYEEYKSNNGFTVDAEYILSGGERLLNEQELIGFIGRVAAHTDLLKERRNEIKALCHQYCDGNATERVTDYIIKNYRLRTE